MGIPEIPLFGWFALACTCPVCKGKIATWVPHGTSEFRCPSCCRRLTSNAGAAMNLGILVGILVYMGMLLVNVLLVTKGSLGEMLVPGGGAIVAIYSGYFLYRARMKIEWINEPDASE